MTEGVVAISFGLERSIAEFASREELRNYIGKRSAADQLWRFANIMGDGMPDGDMVVLPRKLPDPKVVAVGRIAGGYEFWDRMEAPHIRPVNWIAQISLSDFDGDFQSSFTGDLTIFTVQKASNAESRIEEIIVANHLFSLFSIYTDKDVDSLDNAVSWSDTSEEEAVKVDLGELITDRILERIRLRFSGGRLGYLVANILRASGYHTIETRQEPEGGISVVAGQGDMGFGRPRLCVQVKSGGNPVDLPDYNRLQDGISNYGADHGLLVSLGDFTRAVRNENERSFFQIRLWGPFDLVDRLLDVYDALPEDIRNDIPLENQKVLMERDD